MSCTNATSRLDTETLEAVFDRAANAVRRIIEHNGGIGQRINLRMLVGLRSLEELPTLDESR
jgi:hypothetical protein